MAKEKIEQIKDGKVKLNYEVEVALLGVMIVIISLIGLLNQGFVGSLITFSLVYLFGCWYQIPLFLGLFFGGYFFIKRKKPKMISNMNVLCFGFLVVFLSIASSKYEGANLDNCFTFYKAAFEKCHTGINVNILSIDQVGGGLIGYILYALIVSVLGEFMTSVAIVILVMSFSYFAFKNPAIHIYNALVNYFERKKDNKKNKVKTRNNSMTKKEVKTTKNKVQEVETHFLTFDIFTQKIFEDDELVTKVVIEEKSLKPDFVLEEPKNVVTSFDSVEEEIVEEPSIVEEKEFYDPNYEFETPVVEEVIVEAPLEEEPTIVEDKYEELDDELMPSFMATSQPKVSEPQIVTKTEIIEETVPSTPYMVNDAYIEDIDIYSLLMSNTSNSASVELKDEVEANCLKINQKLEELNIKARVSDYIIGPCVTRYEIVPEIGVKVSSIVNIQNDLKLALAAVNLRMEAPIPGKSAIGIEVANKKRYPVFLKEVLDSKRDSNDKLLVAIGKDLANEPVTISIDKMPHLLIAGATGSGKSVCINAIIMSLILRATPEEVKLILIDPKKVEMLPYANMPHLLCPVVIDPKKASNALKKVVAEMDRRYEMFASHSVRNIDGYNNLDGVEKMYKLVVIIDELADLMLAASKEVEESIQRITQLARAAGIYLIVATQRPSVDVITGVIKANIPSRIAFSVSSMVDSRTILDRAGAEDLLGKGDMLMDISGTSALNRVQGVLVSDDEIFAVVREIKKKYQVEFDEEFLNLEDDKKDVINNLSEVENTTSEETLYNDIKAFVIRNQKASTSLLQRYFSLGYARAARMMDRLEEEGIVSEGNGIRPREVLIKEVDENGDIE
ncbi:MAG: DNA translocase FtsK [Bacilli bacterium]|nr:DNA translocase FtsK [Bacilli bacterium]